MWRVERGREGGEGCENVSIGGGGGPRGKGVRRGHGWQLRRLEAKGVSR